MKINETTGKYFKQKLFRDIGIGEVFKLYGKIYMRIEGICNTYIGEANAVDLESGEWTHCDDTMPCDVMFYNLTCHKIPDFKRMEDTMEMPHDGDNAENEREEKRGEA